jgi:hypothetical protein
MEKGWFSLLSTVNLLKNQSSGKHSYRAFYLPFPQ